MSLCGVGQDNTEEFIFRQPTLLNGVAASAEIGTHYTLGGAYSTAYKAKPFLWLNQSFLVSQSYKLNARWNLTQSLAFTDQYNHKSVPIDEVRSSLGGGYSIPKSRNSWNFRTNLTYQRGFTKRPKGIPQGVLLRTDMVWTLALKNALKEEKRLTLKTQMLLVQSI